MPIFFIPPLIAIIGSAQIAVAYFCHRISFSPPEMEYQEYCTHHNDVNDTGYQKFVMPLVDLITSNHYVKQIGLDFGAGSGPVVTKMLEDRGFTLQVYDPFFHPDTTVLDNTYDFIVTCEVVEHFYHPRETFTQLMKMLKPNGVLYCKTELFTDAIDFTQWRYPREVSTANCSLDDIITKWCVSYYLQQQDFFITEIPFGPFCRLAVHYSQGKHHESKASGVLSYT